MERSSREDASCTLISETRFTILKLETAGVLLLLNFIRIKNYMTLELKEVEQHYILAVEMAD